MKILVTGGAGFIGGHIVKMLLEQGYQPVIVDNLSKNHNKFIPREVKVYKMDITSEELNSVFELEKPEYVIHHAAQVLVSSSMENPVEDAKTNILGTINLLELSLIHGVKKFIYASSCAVYGDKGKIRIKESHSKKPNSFYGLSKSSSEEYIKTFNRHFGLPFTILRYSNVYGPNQEDGVVSKLIRNALLSKPFVIYGDGNQTRDFVYVKDIASANIKSIKSGKNKVININSSIDTSINSLVKLVSEQMDLKLSPVYLPPISGEIKHSLLNNFVAKKSLDWTPSYDLSSGLSETIKFYKENLKYE